jgi:branched-chain amino acid transport system permease protein
MFLSTLILGVLLGGIYSLVALGLTVQYGISRIMNLAYGEMIIVASFVALTMVSGLALSPLLALLIVPPFGFALGYFIYGFLLSPLVKRAPTAGALEVDSILATFGLMFVIQGVLLVIYGGNIQGYSFLNSPINVLGMTVGANKVLAFAVTVIGGALLYYLFAYTRWGASMRAVATRPENAALVGIDVHKTARLAFAIGAGLAASAGVLLSMYQTFTATAGVALTMKALVVVMMGGAGNLLGAICAGLILGLVETFVSAYLDPGLTLAATYSIFLLVLLLKPNGLFGRAGA